MAKITITIEDLGDGNVKTVADPSFDQMMKMDQSGYGLTAAHGYAFRALNAILAESKRNDPNLKIWLPKVGKP